MHTTRVVFLMLILALAATAAIAQTCGCQAPACPAPAPVAACTTCPTVTTPACPAPCDTCAAAPTCGTCQAAPTCGCTVPAGPPSPCGCAPKVAVPSCAIAAGFGGGPLDALQNAACGCNFDKIYLESMFPLHADIIALATEGMNRATDRNLRGLSAKIRQEQIDQNNKLALWYGEMGCGVLSADYCAPSSVTQCLCSLCPGQQFDMVYAQTMSDMLMKLRDSQAFAATRLQDPRIINQAQLVTRVSQNEINALQNWIAAHAGAPGVVYTPAVAGT